jgi:anaerobic ribonucleoside-triphosphate reductase activating protein
VEIAAYYKNSIIDYPGKMSLVVYTQGCNRHCPHCHNKDLIPKKRGKIEWSGILDLLDERKSWLDAIVFTGGEPTLQPDLYAKMMWILASYKNISIGLHTNGDYLTPWIAETCDYILLSQHNRNKIQIAKKAKHLSLSTVKWNVSLGKYENKIVRIQ